MARRTYVVEAMPVAAGKSMAYNMGPICNACGNPEKIVWKRPMFQRKVSKKLAEKLSGQQAVPIKGDVSLEIIFLFPFCGHWNLKDTSKFQFSRHRNSDPAKMARVVIDGMAKAKILRADQIVSMKTLKIQARQSTEPQPAIIIVIDDADLKSEVDYFNTVI